VVVEEDGDGEVDEVGGVEEVEKLSRLLCCSFFSFGPLVVLRSSCRRLQKRIKLVFLFVRRKVGESKEGSKEDCAFSCC
jgi:hypothetical protein